jgi:hypothetical protein
MECSGDDFIIFMKIVRLMKILVKITNMARNIYYQSMFGHFSIEITKHLQN